ncbi:MAG: ATP-binding protein [Bradymonadia bacterium]
MTSLLSRRFPLRTKVTLLLLALSLAPLVLNGVINESQAVEHGREQARHQVDQAAKVTARALGLRLNQVMDELRGLARHIPVDPAMFDQRRREGDGAPHPAPHIRGWQLVHAFVGLEPLYMRAFVAQRDGHVLFTTPFLSLKGPVSLAEAPWFSGMAAEGGVFLMDVPGLTPMPAPAPVALTPIYDGPDTPVAWLGVVLDRARLMEITDLYRDDALPFQQTMVVDPVGTYGAHTVPRQIGQAIPRWLAASMAEGDRIAERAVDDQAHLVAHYSVADTKWHLVMTVPTVEAFRSVHRLMWFSSVVILLTFIFVLLFANTVADVLLKPIHELEQGAEMLGAGALDYRIKLDSHGEDELGRLAGTFNRMGDNLLDSQKRTEAYARNLEVAQQELDAMVFAITHDLKKSLRGIEAFANFLQEDYSEVVDEEGQDLLGAITVNVHRINHLADDLIGLVEDERTTSERSRFGMEGLLQEARERSLEQCTGEIVLPPDLPSIMADRDRLLLVFVNLMTNGLKFNQSGAPTVTLSCEDLGVYWQFEVADNGIGIEPRYHEQIFELFSRLNHIDEYEGTGTGLNLARRIVEEHRGTLAVDSAPDEGTRFIVTLPKDPALLTSPGVADL